MSFDRAIGAPYTLASLPKSINATNGRVHAAGLCSISGIKKRKRTEIAVGLDGEGVSIYSLQNPQLVASYALPPGASFTTAPYSIYRKGSSKKPSQRFTYASLAGSNSGDKPQLVCFHEKSLDDQSTTAKSSYTHSEHPAQILALESLPVPAGGSARESTHDVIATFDNGDVICLSANLEVVRWVANIESLVSPAKSHAEFEHVSLATARAISRGILRNRADVTATLLPNSEDESSDLAELTQVLCVVSRQTNGNRTLTLLQLQSRSADLPTNSLTPIKKLLSLDLPRALYLEGTETTQSHIALSAASGALHILVKDALLSYDLTGTVPRLTSELTTQGMDISNVLRLSQDSLFTASENNYRVFDVKFNSLQATLSTESGAEPSSLISPSKKRKQAQSGSETRSGTRLVAYFAELGMVVAARGSELLGLQFGETVSRKRARADGPLLVDALGKGMKSKSTSTAEMNMQGWSEKRAKLDRYASKGKIARFEEAFAALLGIQLEEDEHATKKGNEVNGGPLTNGFGPKADEADNMEVDQDESNETELRKWTTYKCTSNAQSQQHRQFALYALSRIFQRSDANDKADTEQLQSPTLKVDVFPPNVFQWLLQNGHLTKESISKALGDASLQQLRDGAIVEALVKFDSDLHILSAVLNQNHFLPIGEVVMAVKLIIDSFDDETHDTESPKLLTNGTSTVNGDHMEVDFASELDAASREIDHALSVLDNGLQTRRITLRPALIRLHSFAGPLISATLRSLLSRRELESLIRMLHFEFKEGGWTALYDFDDSEEGPSEANPEFVEEHAIAIIASLLNSTLDAIGTGAWVGSYANLSSPGSENPVELVSALHKDTSEALNGFWESCYMRGLLSEWLRYARAIPTSQKPSAERLQQQRKPFPLTAKLEGDGELRHMPMGGKPDLGIEKTKKTGGREQGRSKREMGQLISRKVPKYSFERIVL